MSTASLDRPALIIALAGQPNVGKSTVFNALTGQNQYVSNWPGKTCEQRLGLYHHSGMPIEVVDLPGTYGLSANTVEEQIARDFLLQEKPDVVIVILDAVTLERNLYLVAELLCLPVPLVLGLNRLDLAEQQGIHVEEQVLEAALGLPVIPMTACKGCGVQDLIDTAVQVAAHPQRWTPRRPEIRPDHRQVLQAVAGLIAGQVPEPYPVDWVALKLLEGDAEMNTLVRSHLGPAWEPVHTLLMAHDDAFLAVASGRYEWIGRMVRAAVVRPKTGQVSLTDRLDRATTHPVWGMLVLFAILGLLFWLTYTLGAPLQTWLESNVVQAGAGRIREALPGWPAWLVDLLTNGVIAGVGTVLTLLPILVIFFIGLGLLEDIGYMARAAFVMDRFMHPMGLHGKSFLTLFLGFGCNVPAVMGTRIIESPKARLITILVTPLAPCTARLSVLALLAPVFFGRSALWVTGGLLAVTMLAILGLGFILHELLGGEHNAFIMELPLYQAPDLKQVGRGVWQRTWDFIKGAGSVILVVSVILWALFTFPGGGMEHSYLAGFGRLLAPIGQWLGLDWQMMVALLTSFVRKENAIPTLAILYGAGQPGADLSTILSGKIAPAAALAYLTVQMLFIPCVATVAAIQEETRSWRWTGLSLGLMLVFSLVAGVGVYQGARLLGWGI